MLATLGHRLSGQEEERHAQSLMPKAGRSLLTRAGSSLAESQPSTGRALAASRPVQRRLTAKLLPEAALRWERETHV